MMTEEQIRQWKQVQINKISQTINPLIKEKEQHTLHILNTILGED